MGFRGQGLCDKGGVCGWAWLSLTPPPPQVVPCHSMGCELSGDAQCPWTDGLKDWSWQGPQDQAQACLPRPSQGAPPGAGPFCAWETLEDNFAEATANSPGL
ncbi:cyclin-dependent kinase 16 [Platysternon megacephalum]|uniref:Cyclin-dependent kinase 16 n=1 Tax=Platysternon megacephalum TaxID=55544 RepID=A0A4D9DC13_9SAUR|nr:cyclin-dependent kinase 16 [Platysternon megacephalum]